MRSLYLFSGMAGLDDPPLGALRALYAGGENARYFTAAIEAVDRVLTYVGADAYDRQLPDGIPLESWLRGAAPAPGALGNSIVDGLLSHLYQLCLLQPLPGAPDRDRPAPAAAIGYSMGLLGAVAAGLRIGDRREFVAYCHDEIAMTALTLIRCHQVVPPREGEATPMAAVLGVPAEELRELAAAAGVHVAISNSDRSHVLAGRPSALAGFRAENADRLARPHTRWSYLRSTAPFHSPLLAAALAEALAERHFMTYPLKGDRMRMPVYVADAPVNFQDRTDLLPDLLTHSVCHPLDWRRTVRNAVAGSRPDQVVDFGPDPSARVFTRESLRGGDDRLRYRSLPQPTGGEELA